MANTHSTSRYRLTDKQIKAASLEPGQRIKKLSDGAGLTVLIKRGHIGDQKYFQQRFKDPVSGKEQTTSLGIYPDTSLAKAREKARRVREDLEKRITPRDRQRLDKEALQAARDAEDHTFRVVAKAWYDECIEDRIWTSQKYQAVIWESLQNHVLPYFGDTPIRAVTPSDIRSVVRRIARDGAWETAQRVLQRIGMVFRWAEDEGLSQGVPTRPAQDWIRKNRPESTKGRNLPHLSPCELPELAQALENEQEHVDAVTYLAIQLQALTLARPGELRKAEWNQIDWDARQWNIPAENMKMKREHVVPLSAPALSALEELREITGNRKWLFPGRTSPRKPMSEATINQAIKRLKPDADGKGAFEGRHTAHSFRHTASTYLNEYRKGDVQPYCGDPVELQLAHLDKNTVRRAYNKATYLEVRTEMMETWGRYWLQCRDTGENVVFLEEARYG
jgi:integrase